MSDIKYYNELRDDPLVLDRYIYVIISETILTTTVIDSFFDEEDAEAKKNHYKQMK